MNGIFLYIHRGKCEVCRWHEEILSVAGFLCSEEETKPGDVSARVPPHHHSSVLLGIPQIPAR
jgi:hypothetical protein